jgi:hypothetical protein
MRHRGECHAEDLTGFGRVSSAACQCGPWTLQSATRVPKSMRAGDKEMESSYINQPFDGEKSLLERPSEADLPGSTTAVGTVLKGQRRSYKMS